MIGSLFVVFFFSKLRSISLLFPEVGFWMVGIPEDLLYLCIKADRSDEARNSAAKAARTKIFVRPVDVLFIMVYNIS